MRVFVLCTGRCGSKTFSIACSHAENFTAGHETLSTALGTSRLAYPDNHIEVDNRLSWLLGRLDSRFGDDPFYIHLVRDEEMVAQSFAQRKGIFQAYFEQVICQKQTNQRTFSEDQKRRFALDMVHTVNENIELFLRNKTKKMKIAIEQASTQFPEFWERIDAKGTLDSALREFTIKYNQTKSKSLAMKIKSRLF